MDLKNILSRCDHTLLSPTATPDDIEKILREAVSYGVASACIPPCYVKFAKGIVGDRLKICTVIGFPNGYSSTETKVFETERALIDGADEIDMVVNIGKLKNGNYEYVRDEIIAVKNVCGDKILKVIVETCLLNRQEKIAACNIVSEAKADYIKTSTGFSLGGATRDDVALFKEYVASDIKIKAAGGIKTLQDAEDFLALGASRLGTSRIINLIKETDYGKE